MSSWETLLLLPDDLLLADANFSRIEQNEQFWAQRYYKKYSQYRNNKPSWASWKQYYFDTKAGLEMKSAVPASQPQVVVVQQPSSESVVLPLLGGLALGAAIGGSGHLRR